MMVVLMPHELWCVCRQALWCCRHMSGKEGVLGAQMEQPTCIVTLGAKPRRSEPEAESQGVERLLPPMWRRQG